jgi:hypothetical protein
MKSNLSQTHTFRSRNFKITDNDLLEALEQSRNLYNEISLRFYTKLAEEVKGVPAPIPLRTAT